jgi:elongation factor 1-alpha
MRLPLSGVFQIKGTGDVLTGRVEQGMVKPGSEVVFLPTHTATNDCSGKVFSVEMHHKKMSEAGPGSNVGMNVKGLPKGNMPRTGDIMVLKSDTSLGPVKSFVVSTPHRLVPRCAAL